jgi:hypothetical protein
MAADPSKIPAVPRWSRPGFISRVMGCKKAESFTILRTADDNLPVPLELGNGHLEWRQGRWENLNLDVQPQAIDSSRERIAALQRENAELQLECEVLLHLLTVSEITKTQAQKDLAELRRQIAHAIGNAEELSD